MSGTKNFNPSSKKLGKAAKDGDLLRSKDVAGFIVLLLGCIISYYVIKDCIEFLISYFAWIFEIAIASPKGLDEQATIRATKTTLAGATSSFYYGIALLVIPVVFGEIVLRRFRVDFTAPTLKLSRLHPTRNLARLLGLGEDSDSMKFIYRFLKFLMSLVFLLPAKIVFVGYLVLNLGDVAFLSYKQVIDLAGIGLCFLMLLVIPIQFTLLIVDILVQRYWRFKRLSMDSEEVKRESRDSEGDPTIKGERRKLRNQIAAAQLESGVRNAKVVLVDTV